MNSGGMRERRDAEACRLTSLFDKEELSIIDSAACCNGEIIVRSDGKKWHTEDGMVTAGVKVPVEYF